MRLILPKYHLKQKRWNVLYYDKIFFHLYKSVHSLCRYLVGNWEFEVVGLQVAIYVTDWMFE